MRTDADAVELDVARIAAGGDGVAHGDDGRVVFVPGALPGERVRARLGEVRRRWARAELVEVIEAAPARIAPPCPWVAEGCGGCDWQHVDHDAQLQLKVTIVRDALVRLGRIAEPEVALGAHLAPFGFRTTLRLAVADGRAGFRRAKSHAVVPVAPCLVAHPLLQDILEHGRFPGATEVVARCSVATGERLAWVRPKATGTLPADVARGPRAVVHERVAERIWQVSAPSFFQSRPDGAEALVAAVRAAAHPDAHPATNGAGALVDAYSGVGLFAGALGAERAGPVVALEQAPSSVADARRNLADLDATVVAGPVERWRPPAGLVVDLVLADPARQGLGAAAVETLASLGAPTLVLISCDAAALGRDAGLLGAAGYRHRASQVVDLFPHTPHVEVVTRFERHERR